VTPRTALAILTYVDTARPSCIQQRLRDAIDSLERTSYRDPVLIVDDGSNCEEHLRFVDSLASHDRYRVIRRPVNGGISRAKNTCLRAISELGAEVGFLAEDDIVFHDGWDRAYTEAMDRSGIQHFSWYVPDTSNQVVACNDCLVTATGGLLGLLLTFTRNVLSGVGGFKIMPRRYGYEHIHWTYRNIFAGFSPFPVDIVDSCRFIERNTYPSSLDDSELSDGAEVNRVPGHAIERLFEPFEE
jgi:glycosyltransferase involved in cell wall biosynthesis